MGTPIPPFPAEDRKDPVFEVMVLKIPKTMNSDQNTNQEY